MRCPRLIAALGPVLSLVLALAAPGRPALAQVAIQDVTSPGGIAAWLVEDHSLPFTAVEIRFRGGTSLDEPDARGATYLMAALLEEGTGGLDSRGFAEARDSLGADFSFDANADSVSVSALMLSENRDAAADLLASALAAPRFDGDALERVRQQVLSGLRADARDPSSIASRRFFAMAFGSHPYASSGKGTEESVAALTREDVAAAHRGALARDRVFVAAAGDITAGQLGALIDRVLGGLPATGRPLPGPAPWDMTGGVSIVAFPSPQSVVLFGEQGIALDDPDFFAAFVLNEALGGGRFSARLMQEVREKRGLTYGIGTWLANMDRAALLLGQFSASNDKVAEAVSVIRGQWAEVARDGIGADELEATKTYLTGAYPLRFDGNAPIAAMLVGMQMQGFPIDYPNTRNASIEAVTGADVRRVAARLLQPGALRFVVVGQPEGLAGEP